MEEETSEEISFFRDRIKRDELRRVKEYFVE